MTKCYQLIFVPDRTGKYCYVIARSCKSWTLKIPFGTFDFFVYETFKERILYLNNRSKYLSIRQQV